MFSVASRLRLRHSLADNRFFSSRRSFFSERGSPSLPTRWSGVGAPPLEVVGGLGRFLPARVGEAVFFLEGSIPAADDAGVGGWLPVVMGVNWIWDLFDIVAVVVVFVFSRVKLCVSKTEMASEVGKILALLWISSLTFRNLLSMTKMVLINGERIEGLEMLWHGDCYNKRKQQHSQKFIYLIASEVCHYFDARYASPTINQRQRHLHHTVRNYVLKST